MPIHSPRSPQGMGFVPLSTAQSNSYQDGDIPLTTVRSNASTGARKRNQTQFQDVDMNRDENEKSGTVTPGGGIGGRRKVHKDLKRAGTDGSTEYVKLNAMGRLYNKIVGFSVITRYLVYVVPVAILLAIPLVLLPITGDKPDDGRARKDRITVGDHKDANGHLVRGPSLFYLFLWIEISWLALWGGKLVAHFIPDVFMFFCGVVSSGTRKYATVLRALEIPLSLFFWGLASWLVFKFFFPDNQFEWVHTIKRILLALYLSSAVFLVEKAIVQLISITYHQRSFANRIHESKREVHLLGLMFDASRTLFPMYCPEFADEDYVISDSIEALLSRGKGGNKKLASRAPMKIIGDVGRFGDKITSVFGNIASEITGKQVFNPNSAHSIVVEALEKARSSEAMARRIWMSFVAEDRDALYLDDIVEVLGPNHREEAEECFAFMDADSNGDVSLDEMVRKVVEIGKERKAIANSMKDISQALAVFDNILLFVVALIIVFIFLACFQSSFITTLATAGTALLSLSFVFAVTTQEFLGSCIFLFVKHPYDVGDRVDITGPEKEQLIVEKISLLYTVFTRIDKMQVVQVPNIILNNLWIENVTRSRAMREIFEISVSYDTSFEDLELLRLEMEKFVRSPENSRDFQRDITMTVQGLGNLDKLVINIMILHKSNWHNETIRLTRRSKFMCALALALKRIPINAPGGGGDPLGGPENPTYSVSVSDEFAAAAREKSAQSKDAARMVPLQKAGANSPGSNGKNSDNSSDPLAAEMSAATELNTRNHMAEFVDDWGYDNTLNSREESRDRGVRRTSSPEGVRQELQLNRESTRGRRKPGETLQSVTSGQSGQSGGQSSANNYNNNGGGGNNHSNTNDTNMYQMTQYPSSSSRRSFDVESQTGIYQPAPPAAYGVYPPPPTVTYSSPGSTAPGPSSAAAAAAQGMPPPVIPSSSLSPASGAASASRSPNDSALRSQQSQGQGQGQLRPGGAPF
ncbi:hypothetical protein VTK73DRAFT_2648 [Phialemonium thermophilum]|uniref:EF-hand domain-containing protein n=1 Tax=Phialemonium thermophilum TaxID=223376 RepID=A0ABR3X3K2_9PEZI